MFEFCLSTRSTTVRSGPDWLHEFKYDGYRLWLGRDGSRVRLITRGGYNWAGRYRLIVEPALKNRRQQFVIAGEAVVLGVDGVADFDALHSRRNDVKSSSTPSTSWRSTVTTSEACRSQCARPTSNGCWPDDQTASSSPVRTGRDRPRPVSHACNMGLEGLVSKRRDRPYQAGRSKHWVKVKNRQHPAMSRVMEAFA